MNLVNAPEYNNQYYEAHCVSDFTEYETMPSVLLPDAEQQFRVFHCPKCKTQFEEPPEHSIVTTCHNCGLHMQAYGNALYIWSP